MQPQPISPSHGNPFLRGLAFSLLLVTVIYFITGIVFRPIMPPFVHNVLDSIYGALLCGPDEHYQQAPILRGTMRRNIVGEGDSWCQNINGDKRDISFSEFNVALALFTIPLISGSVLLWRSTPQTIKVSAFRSSVGGDLSSRLQELQNTYDKGLISQEEYTQTRANLLKQMEK